MKHYTQYGLLAVLMMIASMGFSQEYHGKQKDIDQILKNTRLFSHYYVNHKTDSLVACYTEDGKILPGGSDIMEGSTALYKWWDYPENVKILHHKVTPSEIRIVKGYAYDYGYYEGETLNDDGTTSAWKGKYVIVWKKVGKDWKIYLDIWNRV
ncbi:MAG: DUF4440 domain-containing protein [Bacteroidia bacterium]